MQLDLIGLMSRLFDSVWFLALVVLAAVSCVWYYARHMAKGTATTKSMLVGQPLLLLAILVAVIAIVAVALQVWDIGMIE
jgi:hypothetical protein